MFSVHAKILVGVMHFMNLQKSKRALLALGLIFVLGLSLFFQNCSVNNSQLNKDILGLEQQVSGVNSPAGSSRAQPASSSANSALKSYAFVGEYRSSAADLSGIKICDYPSYANCKTDADGRSKGRSKFEAAPLSPSSNVQIMKFQFRSEGFLSNNLQSHFAMGLRGQITHDENQNPIGVNGRGFIIGYVGGRTENAGNQSCQTRHGQIESYYNDIGLTQPALGQNKVFAESCTDTIFEEQQTYNIEVYVSLDRKIGYKIYNSNNELLHQYLVQDPTNHISLGLNEWFIGHVFDTPVTSAQGNWKLIIQNIDFLESQLNIEEYFNSSIHGFTLGDTALANGQGVSYEGVQNYFLSLGDFSEQRTRVYGCANPVNSEACLSAANYRQIGFASDESFEKIGKRLRLKFESLAPYPAGTYELFIRLNPADSQNQYRVKITK